MATYAVGDIQGCIDPLLRLLEKVKFDTSCDTLWAAGDIVNRGPHSLKTLRFIKSLGKNAVIVLGNHDLHLMAHAMGYKRLNRSDTLRPIINAPDCDELLHWLHQQPLLHHDKSLGYTMVHAGIPPIWDLEEAKRRAKEVESVLKGKDYCDFFAEMYGNEPNCWNPKLKGMARLRVITNYFTRMRFCSPKGELEFDTKTSPNTTLTGYSPWFSHKKHKFKTETLLFGHWAALEGKTDSNRFIGLDTGCVWGGKLTMLRLEDKKFFSVKNNQ